MVLALISQAPLCKDGGDSCSIWLAGFAKGCLGGLLPEPGAGYQGLCRCPETAGRRVASAKGKAKAKPKGRPAAKARAGLPPGVLKLAETTSSADLVWNL